MRFNLYIAILFSLLIASCGTIPKDTLKLTQKSLELRQIQQKEYDDVTEKQALIASANVLQDIGFIIKESEGDLGLLVAEKDRDATDNVQVGLFIMHSILNILAASQGVQTSEPMAIDKDQKIRVSLITRIRKNNSILVRASFQRIIKNTNNVITKMEHIKDKQVYQDFFTKLDKSIFLAKQGI